MKAKLFGIPNCGSVQKARAFLADKNIEVDFHDYKKAGIDKAHLEKWCQEFGWEKVVNKKGMTWRNLNEPVKSQVKDQESAVNLMLSNTSVIKRPVVETAKGSVIGFDEEELKGII